MAQRLVWAVSALVCGLVAFLMVGPRPDGVAGAIDVSALPWVNAALNSTTVVLLLAGLTAIRTKRVRLHRALMTSALAVSAAFLASYVVYHWFSVGPVKYAGAWRGTYLFVLATHMILAITVLPLALTTWVRGWSGEIAAHRRLAPYTFGVWMYVSVTGVGIVFMAHG